MYRLVLLALLGAASTAHADSGMLPGGASIQFNRLFLHENNNPDPTQPVMPPDSLFKYFNRAHCACSLAKKGDPTYHEGKFAYELLLENQTTPIHRPLEIWVGASCDDTIMRPMNCHVVDQSIVDIASIATTNGVSPEVDVFDLMEPEPSHAGMGCEERVLSGAEWAISDSDGDGTPDYFVSKAIATDSQPPPVPTVFRVEPGESAINISWDAPVGNVSDIAYYQALCADASDAPAKPTHPTARYQTTDMLCGVNDSISLMQVIPEGTGTGTDPDADMSVPIPDGISHLDPTFICGENPDATATSLRIDHLTNGAQYRVALVAIDKSGNFAGVFFETVISPKPVTDFWEDLHARGSDAQGGFCLLAETYGDDNPMTQALRGFRDDNLAGTGLGRRAIDLYYATLGKLGPLVHGHPVRRIAAGILLLPLVLFALAWHYLTLPGTLLLIALLVLRRRLRWRLPRRLVLASAALLPLVLPAAARAQAPYWEQPVGTSNDKAPTLADETDDVTWHVGVRIGPYIPAIDDQLGMHPGPYESMFGKKPAWVPMIDVDRVLWRGFGQLTLGATVGYLSRTAHAFEMGTDPADPNRPRSKGDETSFRLIPAALVASYRLTYFDDEYGVPLVPYVKGGLAYYAWWSTDPAGDFSTINGQNKAAGASLGVTGSVGLSIRAERIDADAARSMREGGILHAGFYAELQAAKVDGFGSSKKLSVGDNTWFAGVDFEF